MWVQQINCNCSKLLLPPDAKNIFETTEKFTHWYYGDDKRTLGSMLHSKLYGLNGKGLKFEVSKEALKQLNLQELNVLKSDTNGVVDQEVVNSILGDVILSDASIALSSKFEIKIHKSTELQDGA